MAEFAADRALCPDGNCIGVLGPDNRCKECGAVAENTPTRDRYLCEDDACIGYLDANGQCKVCGKVATHFEPDKSPVTPPPELGPRDPRLAGLAKREDVAEEVAAHVLAHSTPASPPDWEDRKLCPDGACIGVIGADGRCGECGRTLENPAD